MDSPGPDTPLYSIAAVARHTGVPAVTLRAWERRYGFPHPSRARGGRRLYTQRDIWTVRALRMHTDQGVPISRAIALLGDGGSPTPAEEPIGEESPLTTLGDQLLEALLDLAAGRAESVLSESLSLLSVEDVCLGLMQPALNEIGRRWHTGEASVAQEHFATGLVRARLSSLLQHALAGVDHPAILAACPPGEWHELGLLMICLFLARRGYTVGYLGANLPAEELDRLVQQCTPRLVLLSAQTDETAEALGDALRGLRRLPPPRPELAYGGWIFNARPELRVHTPGAYLGADARAAVATVEQLLGAGQRTPGAPLRTSEVGRLDVHK
jgi:MerR family transcriptional regulator, light-induced transcriptional regulator